MLKLLVALSIVFVTLANTGAQSSRGFDDSATNLMVVLRESAGGNKQEESLEPMGKGKVKLANGQEIEVDMGWYAYLGDMHIRFVFDTPTSMPNATPKDLERLGLTPEAALVLAIKNVKRAYGEASSVPWDGDVMEVTAKSPDLISSYFLDKEFWNKLLQKHPEGIVALVAKRGGMLYVPVANTKGVDKLRKTVSYLHASSEKMRISSGLYLFKNGKWSVFQAPVGAKK